MTKLLPYLLVITLLLSIPSILFAQTCVGGFAGIYPCDKIDLQSKLTLSQLGTSGDGNDVWGWTDPMTGKEYAIMGLENGTVFVDISDPTNPLRVGNLATHSGNSDWRDIKVINNYAYIVSEASNHGLQVFDLTRLRNAMNPPVAFTEDGHMDFGSFGRAHNVVANEEAGFIYLVGTSGYGGGGITTVDISDPVDPVINMGNNYSSDGYTHDAVCIQYRGPDTEHIGKEICIGLNTSKFVILDMTDKENVNRLSTGTYSNYGYVHQGWVTDDHRYLLVNDETDESSSQDTRTFLFDIADLDNPIFIDYYEHSTPSIDHNLYMKGRYSYQANYRAGLRILDTEDIANGNLSPTAFFDVYPSSDARSYSGAWSNYPYFKSGNIPVSTIFNGLFIVKPTFSHYVLSLNLPTVINLRPGESKDFTLDYNQYGGFSDAINLSISNLPADLEVNLSQSTINADGQITVTVTAKIDAAETNHSLLLEGETAMNMSAEKIALGVVVSGEPIVVCNDNIVVDDPVAIEEGVYSASNSISSASTILENTTVVFQAGQEITLSDGFLAEYGSLFTARIQPCTASVNPTPNPTITPDALAKIKQSKNHNLKISPNPTASMTSISLVLEEESDVALQLYDLTGKQVRSIAPSRSLEKGEHYFNIDAAQLKTGLYVLRVEIGEQRITQKLSVIR